MPVKDMKPIDLENIEVRSTDGRCFKEISRLSDEDLFTTHDYEDLARAFIDFGNTADETVSAIMTLHGNILPYLCGYSNNWLRMHGMKSCRRTLKERRWKPCGKGKKGKLNRA